jgi:hypothetical protein
MIINSNNVWLGLCLWHHCASDDLGLLCLFKTCEVNLTFTNYFFKFCIICGFKKVLNDMMILFLRELI